MHLLSASGSAWLLLLGLPLLNAAENPGIKLTIQQDQSGPSGQRIIYLQGDRKRVEYRNAFGRLGTEGSLQAIYGPRLVSITRCDLGQYFELNLDASEYTATIYPPKQTTMAERAARGLPTKLNYVSDQPTLRIEVTTSDTGERKEMFGYTARHVITTRKQIPLEGSQSGPQESVTDAWYIDPQPAASADIDLNQRLSCDPKLPRGKRVLEPGQRGSAPRSSGISHDWEAGIWLRAAIRNDFERYVQAVEWHYKIVGFEV
jgi:hypothetical protein